MIFGQKGKLWFLMVDKVGIERVVEEVEVKPKSRGGVTSGWFVLESTLLTLTLSAAALSFYRDRTTKSARRMFRASLLYLPAFMCGLLFHRLYENQQCLAEPNLDRLVGVPSSETQAQERETGNRQNNLRADSFIGAQAHPPVAYASVAPFPFLPAPLYSTPDL
ncbi:hypothetical protein HHK36_006567 [Tetracentron sinense]|uniref:Uncharacterized protein n=1 Tax=Tetracentron sinense TaxID=13715 RepID=A0A835DP99_TETSI|nr:hypothetical protein HHK36_006567 [Tetracentron sinense]